MVMFGVPVLAVQPTIHRLRSRTIRCLLAASKKHDFNVGAGLGYEQDAEALSANHSDEYDTSCSRVPD
jgi:hypothetical protein